MYVIGLEMQVDEWLTRGQLPKSSLRIQHKSFCNQSALLVVNRALFVYVMGLEMQVDEWLTRGQLPTSPLRIHYDSCCNQ